MWSTALVCLFVVFCGATYYPSCIDPCKEPIYSIVLCRHGKRTPFAAYPNDIYFNYTYPPYGFAEIRNEGKMQMFELGEFLRYRYESILEDPPIPQVVWGQSADTDRTKVALLAALAGLFPPKGTPYEWNTCLDWNPIPIQYSQAPEDFLVTREACARYFEAVEEVLASPEIQKIIADNEALMEAFSQFLGLPINNPIGVEDAVDVLQVQNDMGLPLTPEGQRFISGSLDYLIAIAYDIIVWTTEMKQIRAGPFIQRMADEFAAKRNGSFVPSERKISFYSAYDYTVSAVMDTYGIRNNLIIQFGYAVLFELVQDKKTGVVGVQCFLRKDENSGAIPLRLPGCGSFCPLDQFISISNTYIRRDRDVLCRLRNPNFVPPSPSDPLHNL